MTLVKFALTLRLFSFFRQSVGLLILGSVVVVDIILTFEPFLPKSVDRPKHDQDEHVHLSTDKEVK